MINDIYTRAAHQDVIKLLESLICNPEVTKAGVVLTLARHLICDQYRVAQTVAQFTEDLATALKVMEEEESEMVADEERLRGRRCGSEACKAIDDIPF